MTEFWESAFIEKQSMWGFTPALSALNTKDLFLSHGIKNILIPGIGYGRNADIFRQNGMDVTGIEISKTAIKIAHEHYGSDMKIFHGSVTDMPFDDKKYDGIFSYALVHLLDSSQRKQFIQDCYSQLSVGGYMVFITISKEDSRFGKGTEISTDRFQIIKGVQVFFYDTDSINQEFGACGLVETFSIDEPNTHISNQPPQKFLMVVCKK